jgi:spore coat protein A, manganese oxidase
MNVETTTLSFASHKQHGRCSSTSATRAFLLLTLARVMLSAPCCSGEPVSIGLSDPALQPKFAQPVPNPLDPAFAFDTSTGFIAVAVSEGVAQTGLVGPDGTTALNTTIWGYGTPELGYTWPGRTFQVQKNQVLQVLWENKIPIEPGYLLTGKNNGNATNFAGQSVVDTSHHWCYSMHGYGTPIVPHLHGGHSDAPYDGNPEYFFSPDFAVKGPQWVEEIYVYDNTQEASALWYHDHALGITRLNVYTGMAGFYFIRDNQDTGMVDNPLNLPAFPYELPLMVQDRMFKETGELFYPAFPGDPYYKDFIGDEGAVVGKGNPTAFAEFFGDHMTVNGYVQQVDRIACFAMACLPSTVLGAFQGLLSHLTGFLVLFCSLSSSRKIWPKADVEPRKYRLRLANGCDSRFLVIQFIAVSLNSTDPNIDGSPVNFVVIGGDQGFVTSEPKNISTLVFEPSARYDVILDFAPLVNHRIIVKNTGGDEAFNGAIPGPQFFHHTDRVIAFDVILPLNTSVPDDFDPNIILASRSRQDDLSKVDRVRRVGLFEGRDEQGRLQPLLGSIDPATDMNGNPINYPETELYRKAGLVGQMNGTATWHAPTTENIKLGDVEDWEIWNLSADAHPMHLHMVKFELISRRPIKFDSSATAEGEIELGSAPHGDGTYFRDMPLIQHDGTRGKGHYVINPTSHDELIASDDLPELVNNFPRDVIVALPGQITTIRARFDKEGRFNWHCHILSHEDHEMMRLYHVGALPEDELGAPNPAMNEVHGDGPRSADRKKLSGAATAGIVVGVFALLGAIVAIPVCWKKTKAIEHEQSRLTRHDTGKSTNDGSQTDTHHDDISTGHNGCHHEETV